MKRRSSLVIVAAIALGAGAVHAQDLTGTWLLQTAVNLPDEGGTCTYAGETSLTQDAGSISGFAELFLNSGPEACPAEMSAELSGSAQEDEAGTIFVLGSLFGPLGETSFNGQITPNPGGSGSFDVEQGDFSGASGSWVAQLVQSIIDIPSLTPIGLILLTLLLLGSGYWVLSRQAA